MVLFMKFSSDVRFLESLFLLGVLTWLRLSAGEYLCNLPNKIELLYMTTAIKKANPNVQAFIKPLFVSHLLFSTWIKTNHVAKHWVNVGGNCARCGHQEM